MNTSTVRGLLRLGRSTAAILFGGLATLVIMLACDTLWARLPWAVEPNYFPHISPVTLWGDAYQFAGFAVAFLVGGSVAALIAPFSRPVVALVPGSIIGALMLVTLVADGEQRSVRYSLLLGAAVGLGIGYLVARSIHGRSAKAAPADTPGSVSGHD